MLHVNALLDRHDAVAALVSDNFVDLMAGASEELDGMIQVPSVRQLYFDSREQGWVWGVRRVVRRGWERERRERLCAMLRKKPPSVYMCVTTATAIWMEGRERYREIEGEGRRDKFAYDRR